MSRAQEIARQLTEQPETVTHIKNQFGCSWDTASQVYKIKGWKAKIGATANDIEPAVKYLKDGNLIPMTALAKMFHISRDRAKQAFEMAGIKPPSRSEGVKLAFSVSDTWPRHNDSMAGMMSLEGLRRAWL